MDLYVLFDHPVWDLSCQVSYQGHCRRRTQAVNKGELKENPVREKELESGTPSPIDCRSVPHPGPGSRPVGPIR